MEICQGLGAPRTALGTRRWSVPLWGLFLIAGASATVGYFVLPESVQGSAYDGFGVVCSVAFLVGVAVHRLAGARAWIWFAIGIGLCALGNLVLTYCAVAFSTQPFPSVADAPYFSGYVVLVAGLADAALRRAIVPR